MAEKLSITILLEGAAEIERQLDGIGKAGVQAFTAISNAAAKSGGFQQLNPAAVQAALQKFGVTGAASINKITAAVAQARRLEGIVAGVRAVEAGFVKIGVAASRVTGALTAIGTAATASLGRFRALAQAFGLLGTAGLAGVLGSAAIAMEKTSDETRTLEGNLQSLFRSAKAGTAFFNEIRNAARNTGASLESTGQTMVGIVQTLRKALAEKGVRFQIGGEGLKQFTQDAAQFFDTLQKGMKLTGVRAEEANKVISALFTDINTKGEITGNTLREIAARFPQLANELVKSLGRPGETLDKVADRVDKGLAKIDITKFINALKRAAPEIQKLSDAFEPTLAQRMDTISGAWNRLLDSFAASPSGAAIRGAMDDIAKGLDEIAKKREQVGKVTVDKPIETTMGKFLEEFSKRIETTKKEWEALVKLIEDDWKSVEQLFADPGAFFKRAFEEAFVKGEPWQGLLDGFDRMVVNEIKRKAQELADFLKKILSSPVQGGQLGGGAVPFGNIPPEVEALGRSRIEDRRDPGLEAMRTAAQAVFAQIQQMGEAAFTAIGAAGEQAAQAIAIAFGSVGQGIRDGLDVSGAQSAWEAIASAVQSAQSAIQQFSSSLAGITWDAISGGVGAWNSLTQAIRDAINALNEFNATKARSPGGAAGGLVGRFQGGGLLGGRGTGTSDSNLIRVSRGEYIIPARAVRQPGVLAFLEALRHSGGKLRDVIDDMGRFALGGLVPRTIPAFASGGLAGMSNVTIQFPGLPEVSGLRAPAKVVEELRKSAAMAQVRSGGRKPSRYS